jgi:GTPase SAR1 family protein
VGKRGSGKTTLLQSWLGPDSPTGGIEESKYLPSGDSDTTACLVRLSLLDEVRETGRIHTTGSDAIDAS